MLRRRSFHRRSCVSGATVLHNEDLLRMILLRLPARSLLKFKSVSKRWFSMISSRNFSHHHGLISPPQAPSGIFMGRRYPDPLIFEFINFTTNPSRAPYDSLDFSDEDHEVEILQSCNGLLLCCVSESDNVDTERDYYVHNPTTNQFKIIPDLPMLEGEDEIPPISDINLAFDPTLSSNYEVVCVQMFDYAASNLTRVKYRVWIYSSATGGWRITNTAWETSTTMKFAVYWKRAIYWISQRNQCFYFDLSDEKLHNTPLPRVNDCWEWEKRKVEYFGDCGGHLYLIEMYDSELDVWEMQENRSGWSVKYHIDFHNLYVAYPKLLPDENYFDFSECFPHFSVIALIDRSYDQIDEESYLVLHLHGVGGGDGEVIRVNVNTGSFDRLMGVEDADEVDAYLFIESLASVI